jgi:hypothetical protein
MKINHIPSCLTPLPALFLAFFLACDRSAQPTTGQAPPSAAQAPTPVSASAPAARTPVPAAPAAAPHKPAAAPAAAPAKAAAVPAAPAPELEVPAGTPIKVVLARELATDRDKAGGTWEGTLAEAVQVGGRVAWAKGTPVAGVVTQSEPAGRLQGGLGGLGIRLHKVGGTEVDTGVYRVAGDPRAARNAKIIGGGAALGALVGALTGHRNAADHALGGAAIGAAAGTAVAAGSADTVLRIPAGKVVPFALTAARRVPAP